MTDSASSAGVHTEIRVMLTFAWAADRRRVILAFALLGLNALVASLFAWWLKLLLDAATAHDINKAVLAGIGISISIGGGAVLQYAGQRTQTILRQSTHALVDRRLIELVGGAPTLDILETPHDLDQLQALQRESWVLGACVPTILEFFTIGTRIVVTSVLLLNVHPLLLLLPLFGLPSLSLSSKTSGLFRLGNERAAPSARLAHHLYELATNAAPAKEVRIFRLGNELISRFHQTQGEIQCVHRRVNLVGQGLGLIGRGTFLIGYFAAISFVVTLAVEGRASVGDAALTAVLAGQVLGLITDSAEMLQLGLRNLAAAGRYLYLSNVAQQGRRDTASRIQTPARLVDGIRLDHVSYRYSLGANDILDDVSLTLPAGATVAIVGDNGARKSTLVKLLAGLYLPTAGTIRVDEHDLAELDIDHWRQRISAGFQDHARFDLLMRESIGVGDLQRLDDPVAVMSALERAGAADLLDAMPAGLDTQLGPSWPNGIDLSGGQWQKIALGRAMMRARPLLLLLDEPTAALDADTEHRLFERWTSAATELRAATGAVTILVSHRFSTVRMADLIVVLDNGRILEMGTHSELLHNGGRYAELFELQARAYR